MIENIRVIKRKKKYLLTHDRAIVAHYDDIQKAHEMRLFLAGIKPMVSQNFEAESLPMYLLKRFHHEIRWLKVTDKLVSIVFFQNVEVQQAYMDIRNNLKGDPYFAKYGELLGYPPVAIADFLDRRKEPLDTRSNIGWKSLCFHGIQFICKQDHVNECLEWLQSTYVIPEEYQAGVRVIDAFVPYRKTA